MLLLVLVAGYEMDKELEMQSTGISTNNNSAPAVSHYVISPRFAHKHI